MKTWNIVFEGDDPGPEDDWDLTFVDASEYIKDTLLNVRWVDALSDQLKNITHYNPYKNVKFVKSSTGDDLSDKSVGLILAVSKEDEFKIGLLFAELSQGGFEIVALWPEDFARTCKDNEDIYKMIIVRLVQDPSFYKDVSIVLPTDK